MAAKPARTFKTKPDGFITQWLALGAIPGNPPQLMATSNVPERKLLPRTGRRDCGLVWSAVASDRNTVDLVAGTPKWQHHTMCCAYVHVYVRAPQAGAAFVALGSDDGAVVWMNGCRVFALDATRGCTPDDNLIPVNLQQGWNRLLIKVLQYAGGWAFCARLLAADKQPLAGLAYSLDDPLAGRWPRPADAHPLSLGIAPPPEPQAMAAEPGQLLPFVASVLNLTDSPVPGGRVKVTDGVKSQLAAADFPALEPLASASVQLLVPAMAWAMAWKQPLRFVALAGDKEQSPGVDLPPSVVESLLIFTSRQPAYLGEEERRMLGRIRADAGAGMEVVRRVKGLLPALEALTDSLLAGRGTEASQRLLDVNTIVEREASVLAGTSVHLVSHAHIDMNWLWRWSETVQICRDTFRQALAFMAEYPQFVFNQSQASCYEAMEREAPEVFAAIARAVKAGRWHVTGGMWTEGDTNLSSGEALARSFLLAQRWFHEKLGVTATCGWLPDNFGHTAQLPQLMRQAGISGFYHMRCSPKDGTQIYWWEAPDGSRVLAKTGVPYGGTVTPDLRNEPARLPQGVRDQMVVYGLGDHGGGPTRKDITSGLRFAESRLMPQVQLSPAAAYFDAVRPACEAALVHKGELNFTLTGCYTSVAKVKQGNRDLENALQAAEAAGVAGSLLGRAWPAEQLTAAWKTLTFNQFHDILPGSAIHESNADSVARYSLAIEAAAQVRTSNLRAVADGVTVPVTDGVPLMIWNSLAWKRSDTVVAEVVLTERFHRLIVLDDKGVEVASQVVRTRDFDCDFHAWVQFLASDVPGLGYRTYTLKPVKDGAEVPVLHWFNPYPPMPGLPVMSSRERSSAGVQRDGWTVTNPFFELTIDRRTGGIAGLRRMKMGRRGPQVLGPAGANRLAMFLEAGNRSSAWVLDRDMKGPQGLELAKPLLVVQEGPESVSWEAQLAWGASRFRLQTTVHADSPRIDCCLEADWLERGGPDRACPMLGLLTSVAGRPRSLACDVPFAVLERQADQEVPAQKWADLAAPGGGLALLNSGKYGHRLGGGVLRLGLLRSFHDPDVLPDVGRHVIRWALLPHDGGWREAGLPRQGLGYNVPLEACQLRPQKGCLGLTHSFLSVEGDPWFVVTGVKQAEDGRGIIVRGYDSSGCGATARIRLDRPVQAAEEVSILEQPWSDNVVTLADGVVSLQVKAAKVVSVRLQV